MPFIGLLGYRSHFEIVNSHQGLLSADSKSCLQRMAKHWQPGHLEEYVVEQSYICATGIMRSFATRIMVFGGENGDSSSVLFMLRIIPGARQMHVPAGKLAGWYDLFERLEWGVVIGGEEHRNILYVNHAFAMMHGYAPNELVGRPIEDVFAPQSRVDLWRHVSLAHEKSHYCFESLHLHKQGHCFPVAINVSTFREQEGAPLRRIVHVQDITNIKEAERALLKSRDLLREIAKQREAELEEERKKIAREIHDELGQLLTTLRLSIIMLQRGLGNEKAELLRETSGMMRMVDMAIDVAEHVTTRLRPAVLDLGLVDALEWLIRDFASSTEIECKLEVNIKKLALSDAVSTAIFRVVQESMTNIARHAHATQVWISLEQRGDHCELCIRDNGIGFDVLSVRKTTTSFGLLGMEERVRALGGELQIESGSAEGVRVKMQLKIT